MKTFLYIILSLFTDAILSVLLSGVFSGIYILIKGSITREKFIVGAVNLFSWFLLYNIYNWIRTLVLMKKDPVFKEMTIETGISWRDYKKLKDDRHRNLPEEEQS